MASEMQGRLGPATPPSSSPTSSMAPKPRHESKEEQVLLDLAGEKPVGSDSGPPDTIPTDTMASLCSRNTSPPATRVGSTSTRLAPEALDPSTLRLLWEQRELEIQALRWAIHHGKNARHQHILQEVAGLPPERSSYSQDALLQNQVQKLTLELRAQKEQAQLEKEFLEVQLAQATDKLQHLEAELQAFQKSCLLHLAQSSWVGRILRSQTGSVEVITAETLIESENSSEENQEPAGEGFRLEDVDWNSIAQRYPNLLTSIHSSSDRKQLPLSSGLDSPGSDSPHKLVERQHKSLEWSTLPCEGTSSSGGADSDSSSCQLETSLVDARWLTPFLDNQKFRSHQSGQTLLEPVADLCPQGTGHTASQAGGSLQIVAVSQREKCVRILNRSQDAADLGGLVLQQRVHDCPVRMFRFPNGTVLEPQHHLMVWGQGTGGIKQHPPFSSGQDPLQSHCSRGCVTLLLDSQGQVLSEYQAPLCVTSGSSVFANNTKRSIDRFPLPEARAGAHTAEPQSRPRPPSWGQVQEARTGHQRPGSQRLLPLERLRKPVHLREGPTRLRGTKLTTGPLHTIPEALEVAKKLELGVPGKERSTRVCRRGVDLGCPMVALSVQSTAESRFGFRFLCCPPITADVHQRLWKV